MGPLGGVSQAFARLVPLYETEEEFFSLPAEGTVTVGRRRECFVVVQDLAVSGTHCILKCCSQPLSFEVEDCSTNGTFVNGSPLGKGQRSWLADGDVLALTRPEAVGGVTPSSVAIQFRLDVRSSPPSCSERFPTPPPLQPQPQASSAVEADDPCKEEAGVLKAKAEDPFREDAVEKLPGVAAAPAGAEGGSSCSPPSRGHAPPKVGLTQDLLIHEQQSKAMVTSKLFSTRRRLDEERARAEALRRELRSAKSALEGERARRLAAQEKCDQFQADLKQGGIDKRQLEAMREEHVLLQARLEAAEVDLGTRQQTAVSLEAAQERLKADLARIAADTQRTEAQLAEAQQKLQQAQERAETLAERHNGAKRQAEAARAEADRLQLEYSTERAAREQFEDQSSLLAADAERAACGDKAARDALAAATAQQAELEERVANHQLEAEGARSAARKARQELAEGAEQVDILRGAAARITDAMHGYMEVWARGMSATGARSTNPGVGLPPAMLPQPPSPSASACEPAPIAPTAVEATLVTPTALITPSTTSKPPTSPSPTPQQNPHPKAAAEASNGGKAASMAAPAALAPKENDAKVLSAATIRFGVSPGVAATVPTSAEHEQDGGVAASVATAAAAMPAPSQKQAAATGSSAADAAGGGATASSRAAAVANPGSPLPPLATTPSRSSASARHGVKMEPRAAGAGSGGAVGLALLGDASDACGAGSGVKRSPTQSVLVLPGQPTGFKRPRLSQSTAR